VEFSGGALFFSSGVLNLASVELSQVFNSAEDLLRAEQNLSGKKG
jgi:hypothetical protein